MKKSISLAVIFCFLIPVACFGASDTLTKALGHITSVQAENGAWSRLRGEFPPEAEPTAWAVKVLAMTGGHGPDVEKGVAFLLKDQKPDGSWNNNTAHTAFAILGLTQAQKGDEAVKKGIAYLRSVQDEQGGFRRIGREGAPLTVYTAVVVDAFKAAGLAGGDPAVVRAVFWLKSCQNSDGGYGMPKGSPSVALGTAWSISAFRATGVDVQAPEVKNGVAYLLTMQGPSGGFSMSRGLPEDPEITAYAIMALKGLPAAKDALAKATANLGKVQHENGAFTSAAPIQFNRQPKENTQTTLFVAWALAEIE